jgi:ankyrin repeat protein
MEKSLTERGLTARSDYELLAAVKATTPERAKALLVQGASPNARRPQDAATALDHCQGTLTDPNPGADVMIELLLAAGAEPDAADDNGNTPLSRAVRFGSLRAVKALIDAGADVKRADYMNIAWPREWPELESLLLASGAAPRMSSRPVAELAAEVCTLLDSATDASALRLFTICSQGKFDINTPLPEAPAGCTALMLAAQRGDIQLVRWLLAMGARAEVQDAAGQNAVDYASVAAQPDIVSLLRKTYVPAE